MSTPNVAARLRGRLRAHHDSWADANGIACGAMTFALLFSLALAGGGFSPRAWRVGILAVGLCAVAALVARERIVMARREWILVGALGSLAGWTALSATWSALPSASSVEAERVLLYALAALAAFLAVERSSVAHVVIGAIAGITATSVYALARHAVTSPPENRYEAAILYEPFGYANALGIYVAIGIVLTIGMLLGATSGRQRACAAAALLVLGVTLLLTSSRGAWIAVAVGSVVVLYLGRWLQARWLSAFLVAGVIVGLALGALGGRPLSSDDGSRLDYWRVAWQDVLDNPLLGSGPGTFGDYLLRHASAENFARDAHSLYLETLAELGPVGLVLLIIALLVPLLGLRGRQEPVVAAAGGAYVTFLVHAGIDWDWEFAAVVLAALSAGVVATIAARPAHVAPISARARYLLLAGVLVVVVGGVARLVTAGA